MTGMSSEERRKQKAEAKSSLSAKQANVREIKKLHMQALRHPSHNLQQKIQADGDDSSHQAKLDHAGHKLIAKLAAATTAIETKIKNEYVNVAVAAKNLVFFVSTSPPCTGSSCFLWSYTCTICTCSKNISRSSAAAETEHNKH